jgi:hypothetical protein
VERGWAGGGGVLAWLSGFEFMTNANYIVIDVKKLILEWVEQWAWERLELKVHLQEQVGI